MADWPVGLRRRLIGGEVPVGDVEEEEEERGLERTFATGLAFADDGLTAGEDASGD